MCILLDNQYWGNHFKFNKQLKGLSDIGIFISFPFKFYFQLFLHVKAFCYIFFFFLFFSSSISFAHRKLEEKSNNDAGCYIIRECEFVYDVYYVDVWISTKSEGSENISTFKIKKDNEGMFVLSGWNESFNSIPELLSYHANKNMLNFQRCIPPSEYGIVTFTF